MAQFDLRSLRQARLLQLAHFAEAEEMKPERVKVVSAAAHNLARWAHAVLAHGKIESVRKWERGKLQELMHQRDITQVLFS